MGQLAKPLLELFLNVWKAIPSQLQLAHKHPLTRDKLILLPSHSGEAERIILNGISETNASFKFCLGLVACLGCINRVGCKKAVKVAEHKSSYVLKCTLENRIQKWSKGLLD